MASCCEGNEKAGDVSAGVQVTCAFDHLENSHDTGGPFTVFEMHAFSS